MGRLFIIESPDGGGKKTQSEKLVEALIKQCYNARLVSFPNYESESSSLVKMYLAGEFGDKPDDVDPKVASMFYACDRYATYKKELKEFYENGGILVCDRYTISNLIHQCTKIKGTLEKVRFCDWLFNLEFVEMGLPKPDMTIFLDVPPVVSRDLISKRDDNKHGSDKDIHEKDSRYMSACYTEAKYWSEMLDWTLIDCLEDGVYSMRSIEDIHKEILKKVTDFLKK